MMAEYDEIQDGTTPKSTQRAFPRYKAKSYNVIVYPERIRGPSTEVGWED